MKKTLLWTRNNQWIYFILVVFVAYGTPVIVGSSWFPSPEFPTSTDGSRKPAFNVGYDTFSFPHFDLAYRTIAQREIAAHRLPLWNPNTWAGVPIPAQYQNQLFSPLEWIDWLGGNRWWNITLLARLTLGAIGIFVFCRALSLDRATSLAGGLLYLFSAYFIGFQSVPAFLNAAVVLPWIFVSMQWAFSGEKIARSVAVGGCTFALVLVTGQPQLAALNLAAAALCLPFTCYAATTAKRRVLGIIILVACLTLGIAAAMPQLLSFQEALRNGYTIHTPGTYAAGSTKPYNFLIPLMPLILGPIMSPWQGGFYPARINHEDFPLVIGAPLFAFSAFGFREIFLRYTAKPIRAISLGMALVLIAILGVIVTSTFGIARLWRFPLVNQINLPRYSSPIISMIFCIAGAIGMQSLTRGGRTQRRIFVVLASAALILVTSFALPVVGHVDPDTNIPLRNYSVIASEIIGWTTVFAVFTVIWRRNGRNTQEAITACGLLVANELWVSVRYGFDLRFEYLRLVLWGAFSAAIVLWYFRSKRIGFLCAVISYSVFLAMCLISPRFLEKSRDPFKVDIPSIAFLRNITLGSSTRGRILTSSGVMAPDALDGIGLPQINGLNPMQPLLTADWFKSALMIRDANYTLPVAWYGMKETPNNPGWSDYKKNRLLYNFMGIRFLIESPARELSSIDVSDLKQIYSDESYRIFEDKSAFPRAFFVRGRVFSVDSFAKAQSDTLSQRLQPSFDRISVVAPHENLASVQDGQVGLSVNPVALSEINPEKLRAMVKLDRPAVFVVTDVYYPGWKALVDEKEVPIYAVAGLVRGIFIEPGEHSIEFIYSPDWLRAGLISCSLGWLSIGVVALAALRSSMLSAKEGESSQYQH